MNPILEYLYYVQDNRRFPYEFHVLFQDYTSLHIEDIHQFHLDTLRKPLIGVAINVADVHELWKTYFLNPFGGTEER